MRRRSRERWSIHPDAGVRVHGSAAATPTSRKSRASYVPRWAQRWRSCGAARADASRSSTTPTRTSSVCMSSWSAPVGRKGEHVAVRKDDENLKTRTTEKAAGNGGNPPGSDNAKDIQVLE